MATAKSDTTLYWSTSTTFPQFAKLADDADADVVVVGRGITGLTAAYLSRRPANASIVLERGRCAGTDSGHTSAHLTMVTDARLSELMQRFGRTHPPVGRGCRQSRNVHTTATRDDSRAFSDSAAPNSDCQDQAARKIHEQHTQKQGPVLVALTGWGRDEDRRRSEEAGFDGHLAKPVDQAALDKLLRDFARSPEV